MNLHRESDEAIIETLRKNRGWIGRLVLALRVLFAPKVQTSGSWVEGARGL